MPNIYDDSKEYRASLRPELTQHWLKLLTETEQRIAEQLPTPAGQKMLWALHSCFEDSSFQPIDRPTIARALGRPGGLTVWDRKLLKQLEETKWIESRRVALPARIDGTGNLAGRGYELRYWMKLDTGYRLHSIRQRRAAQLPDLAS